MRTVLSVSLSDKMATELDALAKATGRNKSDIDPIEPTSSNPDDDKILACALVSRAGYLVSGDEDLLVIKQYGQTEILALKVFESLFAD